MKSGRAKEGKSPSDGAFNKKGSIFGESTPF